MQIPYVRYLVLTVLLLAGAGVYAYVGDSTAGDPRWPAADALYVVEGWSTGPQVLGVNSNRTQEISRSFGNAHGQTATLTIFAQEAPKLYGPGAEVPFLGNGFTVQQGTVQVPRVYEDGLGSLVAQRGDERWFVMYAYGERRGLLGNGPLAWSLAALDGVLGRPNDYYKLYLMTRATEADVDLEQSMAGLAATLFPRVSAWYSA